ncbi:MAG: hypothetical protein IPP83_11110 [Flavobacteriales bacterium]|nr:hypothetical protein [Flavobacteriales bacterium]
MSKYYLGVDLGSTTSKAIIINEKDEIIGRGITNTRANYSVAADIARDEAIYDARFSVLKKNLEAELKASLPTASTSTTWRACSATSSSRCVWTSWAMNW